MQGYRNRRGRADGPPVFGSVAASMGGRVAVLVSGGGTNLQALLDDPQVAPHIALVLSDRPNVRALERIVGIRRNDTADKEAEFLNDVLLYAHATGTHIDLVAPEPNQVPEPVL